MTSKRAVKNHLFKIAVVLYLLAFLVNWYRLPQNLFFGHEQGRDAQAAREIYTAKHFPLISTKTEVEGVYSPSWYYYIMSIPYGLSAGNPTAGILTIVLFNSTIAPIMFFFVQDLLKSEKWGLVAATITILSWELINYARWLSNVSPAYPLVALALYMAWRYYKSQKNRDFLLYSVFAILALQFQITLIFQFALLTLALFAFKFFKFPSFKTIAISLLATALLASPLIVFDFRHEHITAKSVLSFLGTNKEKSLIINPKTALTQYVDQMQKVTRRTLFNINHNTDNIYPRQSATYLLAAAGAMLLFGLYFFAKNKAGRKVLLFCCPMLFHVAGDFAF